MQDKKKAFAFQAGGALAAALIWLLGVLKNGRVDMNAAVFGNVFLFYLTALAGIYLTFIVSRVLTKAPVIKGFLALCGRCSLYIMGYHIYAPIVMNIVAVSYTHLDVYKRQPVYSVIIRAVVPVPQRKCPFRISLFASHH